jgi:hypothetical protein
VVPYLQEDVGEGEEKDFPTQIIYFLKDRRHIENNYERV